MRLSLTGRYPRLRQAFTGLTLSEVEFISLCPVHPGRGRSAVRWGNVVQFDGGILGY